MSEALSSYKARKEAFVSNLSGSSLSDINLVTLVAPVAILLWTALQRSKSLFKPYSPAACLVDFLLNIVAILFAFTVYAQVPLFLNIVLVVPAIFLLIFAPVDKKSAKQTRAEKKNDGPKVPVLSEDKLIVRPFLTHYRGSMLIATTIAILAVDFPIFPRRFAKVETWGTSLMDLGVGSFVFSAGIVGARPLIRAQAVAATTANVSISHRLIKAWKHSIPLLVLGMVRLISVKNLDYAEHVTEYGVHWNFFFTLAFLPPFVEAADIIVDLTTRSKSKVPNPLPYYMLAMLIAVVYEIVLDNTDLLRFVLIHPRTPDSSLLVKNREGIFSFIGYLSVYLCGRCTGLTICRYQGSSPKFRKLHDSVEGTMTKVSFERSMTIIGLLILAIANAALFWLSSSVYVFNLIVSRRLANLPYVLWIVAYNNAQLVLFALVESYGPRFLYKPPAGTNGPKEASSRIMQVFNSNGLVIFLIANLLTGLVNLTMNTLDMSNMQAMAVLIAYAAAVSGVALGFDFAGIKIKL